MPQIINGRKYDTETASEVYAWDNGRNRGDFHWCAEALYQKRTGEFFLAGAGGAMSPYREKAGDMWGPGERIQPLTESEAAEWLEDHGTVSVYEEIFGEVPE